MRNATGQNNLSKKEKTKNTYVYLTKEIAGVVFIAVYVIMSMLQQGGSFLFRQAVNFRLFT